MIFEKQGNLHLYKFESFEEYLDRASNPVFKHSVKSYASGWGHKPTFEKALLHARNGWADVTSDIETWTNMMVGDISSHIPKPDYVYDMTGSMWDLGRVVENDPECWVHEEPGTDIDRSGRGNIVRMVINTASSAAVRENSHKHRCGAIMALTQLLEMSGFYVEFEITTAIQVNSKKLEFRTVAKRAGEALNLAAVSYWCSQFMEREIDFAICETMPECLVSGTNGWSYKLGVKNFQVVSYGTPIFTQDPGDICFDRMHSQLDGVNWNDQASVRKYIVGQLKKQGIVLS